MSGIVSNCLPTTAAAAAGDDDSSALKYNKNYRRIRRLTKGSSSSHLQVLGVVVLLLLVVTMGWILGAVIGWDEVHSKVKEKMKHAHRERRHGHETTPSEDALLKEFEQLHQRKEQRVLRRGNNGEDEGGGGSTTTTTATATTKQKKRRRKGAKEDDEEDVLPRPNKIKGGEEDVKDGPNNEQQQPKQQRLLDDPKTRTILSKMISSYFSTITSTDNDKAKEDVKDLLLKSDEDPEWVEQLLEEAEKHAKQRQEEEKRAKQQQQARKNDSSSQTTAGGGGSDSSSKSSSTTTPTMDKHLQNLEYIAKNCLGDDDIVVDFGIAATTNEQDGSAMRSAIDRARHVLRNCKLLVLRNALPREYVEKELIPKAAVYLDGLSSQKVHHYGPTTNGEHYFYAERDTNRWEVLLPQSLVEETKQYLVLNSIFLNILNAGNLLGEDLSLMSAGVNFASPGAVGQGWHEDERYIFDDDSYSTMGIAGHDTPSIAVTVSIPLLDVEPSHGPTEFCMGSSAIQGMSIWQSEGKEYLKEHTADKSLVQEGSTFDLYTKYGYGACHPMFWKSPTLQVGDVLMFDYQLKHRGGWNTHPTDARAILFLTYSRYWFKDSNFHQDQPEDQKDLDFQILKSARFAVPENWEEYRKEQQQQQQQQSDKVHPYTSVTSLGPIDPYMDKSEEDGETYGYDPNEKHQFVISNKNVKSGILDVMLYWNDDQNLGTLRPGQSKKISHTIRKGDVLSLRTKHKILYEWPVMYHGQVVFHKDMKPSSSN